MPKLVIQSGAQLDDWGTPREVLDFVRLVCNGPITRDLASNPRANKLVQAKHIFTKANPCPDAPVLADGEVVYCNPPGPVTEVRRFWDIWQRCMGWAGTQGAFLIFDMDHWRALAHPTSDYQVVIWRKRLRFVGAPSQHNHPSALVVCSHGGVGKTRGPVVEWL